MPIGKIDVHFHLIPQFFRDAVHDAGLMLPTASYPNWSPELALGLMDEHKIRSAMRVSWPRRSAC